jgi:hypothetical protein
MKAQCERCQAEVELSFAPAPGGIVVSCPACKASYFVASVQDSPARAPEGDQECPKCGLRQPRAEACRRCGLVFARWTGEARKEAADGEAALLWAACEVTWDDPARHDAFISYCNRSAQFSYAAGRYRAAQAARGPAAEPVASRSLERIEKLALSALQLSSRRELPVEAKLPYRNAVLMLAGALLLIVMGLLWALLRQQHRPAEPPERIVPVVPRGRS